MLFKCFFFYFPDYLHLIEQHHIINLNAFTKFSINTMSSTLKLRFQYRTNSFSQRNDTLEPFGPLFHKFLPACINNCVSNKNNEYEIKLWFEPRGYIDDMGFFETDSSKETIDVENNIKRQAKVDAGYLIGQIDFFSIQTNTLTDLFSNVLIENEYMKLGKKVYDILYANVYDFVYIFKFNYGQYWLKLPEKWDSRKDTLSRYFHSTFDLGFYNSEQNMWYAFEPSKSRTSYSPPINLNSDDPFYKLYINQPEWEKIKKHFLTGVTKSKTLEYLQYAHASYQSENYSKAYIEIVTALDLAIDEHFDKLKANNKEIQNQLQRFTDLPLNAKFSNICLLLNLCSEKEIEQSLDVIKTRNKIVHEGYVIENDENQIGRAHV